MRASWSWSGYKKECRDRGTRRYLHSFYVHIYWESGSLFRKVTIVKTRKAYFASICRREKSTLRRHLPRNVFSRSISADIVSRPIW